MIRIFQKVLERIDELFTILGMRLRGARRYTEHTKDDGIWNGWIIKSRDGKSKEIYWPIDNPRGASETDNGN